MKIRNHGKGIKNRTTRHVRAKNRTGVVVLERGKNLGQNEIPSVHSFEISQESLVVCEIKLARILHGREIAVDSTARGPRATVELGLHGVSHLPDALRIPDLPEFVIQITHRQVGSGFLMIRLNCLTISHSGEQSIDFGIGRFGPKNGQNFMIVSYEKDSQAFLEPPTGTDAVAHNVPVIAVLGHQNWSNLLTT